ncbi:MAG: WhiB family transcriptional regulator [Actinobacteria bacterium]|jgi:WhiB family redox-sensing transcriptional regulator|nr:WhiB family transcriptional regulator [Actinomycetota bacterium]MCB0901270.1 WhiB family transcriptional regulator [Actinomycetota bacterium]MCB8996454.1 WhiB family transcriptional regulator [Actinomycetota bacterium]MCB9425288.1 WhiB family transcriptional regulator [Actinomycetota bacterium]HRY08752.1 WhiB family transcriptional regulator [Candidatus Nanopelagicales bacterium]
MPQQPLSQVPADAIWDWQEIGSCREADPELFFHPQNERGLARLRRDRAAKAVCARCDVRIDCADYAIRAREPYGVWGGLTEEERERVYVRIALAQFPRQRGEGAVAAAAEISEAVSPGALGVVS